MPLYRWSELKSWLDAHDLFPKRGLSQNFLIDGNVVHKILDFVPKEEHPIIEIGPGPGVLTEALFERGQTLFLIEADHQLAPLLKRFQPKEIHMGDALKIDPSQWLSKRVEEGAKATILSNLPYHLSTPFFKKWLMSGLWAKRLVIMVQKEFAQRLTAKAQNDSYCPLSVLGAHYIERLESFDVPASCFYPSPKVTSTVLCIDLFEKVPEPAALPILEHLFNQRRKIISGVIKRKGWRALTGPLQSYEMERTEHLPPSILWEIAHFLTLSQDQETDHKNA